MFLTSSKIEMFWNVARLIKMWHFDGSNFLFHYDFESLSEENEANPIILQQIAGLRAGITELKVKNLKNSGVRFFPSPNLGEKARYSQCS